MQYSIYRNTTLIATVNPTGTQTKQIMGANTVAMSFTLPTQTTFEVGDYVDVYGERYYINFAPSEKEQSSIRWEYSLTMQVAQYDLAKVTYFGYNSTNQLTLPDHDLTGNADTFLTLLIANLNRKGAGGYTKGTIDVTEVRTEQFSGENCLAVLSRLAEVFKTEYWIEGKTIHLSKRGEILPITLKYGQGNGLRKIERVPVDENPPVTMLFVYGGTKNLPASYRDHAGRLQLPVSGAPLGYLANPIPNFENEDVYINENIFPERTGVVTGIVGSINSFSDSALDFDINAQLIPGVSAKVKFISGALSGYQFEISSYNHTTKTIKFNNNTDEKAFTVPSESQKPAIGDKWVIFDIILPQSHIDDAEARLLADGLEYKEQNTGSRYNFNLETDPFHFERNSLFLSLGKYIGLVSEEWGLSGNIRIVGYTRDIQKPYEYPSVEVSHSLQFNKAVIADSKQRELEKAIQINKLTDIQRARNNWRTTAELATILDTLKAEMLLIMVEGGQYSSDIASSIARDSFSTTAGTVQHEEYIENGGIWNVTAFASVLSGNTPKHVYIKADKASIGATVVLSDAKIGVEDVVGFYHFPFGIISSIIDNTRIFSTTKGYVRINGNNIQAGQIISTDGLTGFNLDAGEIFGKIKFRSSAGGLRDIDTAVTDLEGATESLNDYVTNTLPVELAAIQDQVDGALESYFYGYDPTLINIPSSDWTTDEAKDTHLGDLFYNNVSGASFRFQKNGAAYEWLLLADTGVSEALAAANEAQDTADGKRRVFVNQPITPYDQGDLWAQGSTGELMRCVTTRLTGEFNLADWGKASKYTDDSYATTQIALVNQDITDVADLVTDLDGYIDGAFKDGIIEQAEAKAIEKYLNSINTERADVTSRYVAIINDTQLTGAPKTELADFMNLYNVSHDNLIGSIGAAILDGKTTSIEKADVDSKFTAYKTALANLSTRLENAINAIAKAKIDAIQIGGRNYVLNSKAGYSVTGQQAYYQSYLSEPLKAGQEYFFSFNIEDVGGQPSFSVMNWDYSERQSILPNAKFTALFNSPVLLIYKESAVGTLKLSNLKLEKGNKATDWTPAPEDVTAEMTAIAESKVNIAKAATLLEASNTAQEKANAAYSAALSAANGYAATAANDAYTAASGEAATAYSNLTSSLKSLAYQDVVELSKLGTTVVDGNYIRTTLLDVAYIKANIINAQYIETLELIVKSLKTKATGKRVEVLEADNNIKLINDANENVVVIDDDVAHEGGGVFGGGVRVGRLGETQTSTTSGTGVYLYKADGSVLSYIAGDAAGNGIGMYTKSGLQVDGLSNLNNITFAGYISPSVGFQGLSVTHDVRVGGDTFYRMRWVKGVLVSSVQV